MTAVPLQTGSAPVTAAGPAPGRSLVIRRSLVIPPSPVTSPSPVTAGTPPTAGSPGPGRGAEAGFSLIEALIALAVLAITAVSFLRATEANVARVSALETRAAAGWVAQNRLAELSLGLMGIAGPGIAGPDIGGPVRQLGQDFALTLTTTATADPGLLQVDIAVDLVTGPGLTAGAANPDANPGGGARLTGFVARQAAGGS